MTDPYLEEEYPTDNDNDEPIRVLDEIDDRALQYLYPQTKTFVPNVYPGVKSAIQIAGNVDVDVDSGSYNLSGTYTNVDNLTIKSSASLSIASGTTVIRRGKNKPVSKTARHGQADILKEDQAQNTCIFSIDFAHNFSFFFSNGMAPEYSVIGRVARRIWAIAMRDKYGANEKSQKLKYHIQTSGRSLHAQEIAFNDIRTTLQGLLAFYDNCNSLHTNSYDEAVTTPTEESVRVLA